MKKRSLTAKLWRILTGVGGSALILLFSACTSVRYISPELPDVAFPRIERPVLQEDDPEGNTVALIAYAEKLEAVIEGWESYYMDLREALSDGDT